MSPSLAAALSALFSALGWMGRSLTAAGAGTAFLVGLAVLAGTGWAGGAALAVFFISSSAVSRLAERWPAGVLDAKGNRRDPWQVAANGAAAALGGLLALQVPEAGLWVVTASLAAAASDTWATSVGALSRTDPLDLVRWRRVPRGTSGGVSLIGTGGGVAGAALVAAAPVAAGAPGGLFLPAFLIGTAGMMADSLLGATVQGRFRCPSCRQPSERTRHRCGTTTEHTGGCRWLGNDGINAIATGTAGLGALLCWRWLSS